MESLGQEVVDQVSNIVQSEEEHVLAVKNGSPQTYPDYNYGEVFDAFFGSPTWRYFEGENGEDVVEFTGWCVYQDVEVEARLQFLLDMENGTFETGAMSFNEVPQTNLITYALIERAFSDYAEANGGSLQADSETQAESGILDQEPESSYAEFTESSAVESTYTGTAADMLAYIGSWDDNRCHITIEEAGSAQFRVEIMWGSSAFEDSEWVMTAAFDGNTGMLNYSNCVQKDVVYSDDGNVTETVVYENGTGSFYIENGYLYWNDETAHAGDECRFERNEYDDSASVAISTSEPPVDPDTPYYAEEGDILLIPHILIENSRTEYLSDADVYFYTPEQLRYAKNEIYARHGRRFTDAELQAWFDAQAWYQGTIAPENFDESLLSELEKANIQVIQHRLDVNSR
ncbi:MAG: YARHG domain-containing protein [Clostridiales bacterium]|nr:YARHG domain-containing protein [Clostridiales bacterium]